MEEIVFHKWFVESFIPYVDKLRVAKGCPDQKALLIFDGHKSHMGLQTIEAALNNKVFLQKLPSHLTDQLQPLDKCVFGPVKTAWDKKLIKFGREQMGQGTGRLTKEKFGELLSVVWSAIKTENVKVFSSTGIFPYNRNAADKVIHNRRIGESQQKLI